MFVASLAHKILVMAPANAQELATVSEALSQHRTERTRFVIIDIKNIADNWRFHRPALKKAITALLNNDMEASLATVRAEDIDQLDGYLSCPVFETRYDAQVACLCARYVAEEKVRRAVI